MSLAKTKQSANTTTVAGEVVSTVTALPKQAPFNVNFSDKETESFLSKKLGVPVVFIRSIRAKSYTEGHDFGVEGVFVPLAEYKKNTNVKVIDLGDEWGYDVLYLVGDEETGLAKEVKVPKIPVYTSSYPNGFSFQSLVNEPLFLSEFDKAGLLPDDFDVDSVKEFYFEPMDFKGYMAEKAVAEVDNYLENL